MKHLLTIASILLIFFRLSAQSDGLVASYFDSPVNDDKLVHSSGSADIASSSAWKHIKSALQYDQADELEKAIKEYTKAIALDNGIAEAYDYRAVCYIKLRKYTKAFRDLEEAIDLNSGFVEAYNHLGIVSYWLDEYQDAINCYTKAILLNPEYATPYFNRAIVYMANDEDDLAYKDLIKAKELNLPGVDAVLNEFFKDKK